jgi:hypothetical protein
MVSRRGSRWWRAGRTAVLAGVLACSESDPPTVVAPTGTVSGRVVDGRDRAPVGGALVTTEPATGTAVTDAEGRYRIEGVPLSRSGVVVFTVRATREGYEPAEAPVSLAIDRTSAILDLTLVRLGAVAGTLRVRVTRPSGEGLAGAVVRLVDPVGRSPAVGTTDAGGSVRLGPVPAGEYTVHAEHRSESAAVETAALVPEGREASVQLVFARFDIAVSPLPTPRRGEGALLGDTIAFVVQVRNDDAFPLADITVRDTLDALVRRLERANVVVDRTRFPDATVEIDPSGLSFRAELGGLPPTAGWVTAYTVRAGRRTLGVVCNRAAAQASAGTTRVMQSDLTCFA